MLKTLFNRLSPDVKRRRRYFKKFLHYFPGGYQSEKYFEWERGYKWKAHLSWNELLNKNSFQELLGRKDYKEISRRAVWIESRTNLLFSFEKMALRDAVKSADSAKSFSEGLFDYIYGKRNLQKRFEAFRDILGSLPVKQTRVLTWPLLTVFGFIADPDRHLFLKPTVTRKAALKYKFDLNYSSKPNWETYSSLLSFGKLIEEHTAHLNPKDMIDIQSFIWVLGSEEYPD